MSSAAIDLDVRPLSTLFKALGDETRLRILALLSHGELCVCHLQTALDISQPNISRHLAILRTSGIVEARRDGSWIHYRMAEQESEGRAGQLRALTRAFVNETALKRDVMRLQASKGPETCR